MKSRHFIFLLFLIHKGHFFAETISDQCAWAGRGTDDWVDRTNIDFAWLAKAEDFLFDKFGGLFVVGVGDIDGRMLDIIASLNGKTGDLKDRVFAAFDAFGGDVVAFGVRD